MNPKRNSKTKSKKTEDKKYKNFRKAFFDLHKCQQQLHDIDENASKEMLKIQAKYNKIRRPFYIERADVIKNIPQFWQEAIVNHPQISMLIEWDDEECLKFLKKLDVEELENVEDGFKIKMIFEKNNPFFKNKELIKDFRKGTETELVSTSTVIKWKRNMDLSRKPPKLVGSKWEHSAKTFFTWFVDNENPSDDEIADAIRNDLWTDPFKYFIIPAMYDSDDESLQVSDDDESDDQWESFEEELDAEAPNNFNVPDTTPAVAVSGLQKMPSNNFEIKPVIAPPPLNQRDNSKHYQNTRKMRGK